jgi:hypothetical protein
MSPERTWQITLDRVEPCSQTTEMLCMPVSEPGQVCLTTLPEVRSIASGSLNLGPPPRDESTDEPWVSELLQKNRHQP